MGELTLLEEKNLVKRLKELNAMRRVRTARITHVHLHPHSADLAVAASPPTHPAGRRG